MKALKIVKALVSPTPLPTPESLLEPAYKLFPALHGIPEHVLWTTIGSFVTTILIWLYNLYRQQKVLSVEIAMKNAVHEGQARMEAMVSMKIAEIQKTHTDQMVLTATLNENVKELKGAIGELRSQNDNHNKRLQRLEQRR